MIKNTWTGGTESDNGMNSNVNLLSSNHLMASNGGIIPPSLVIRPSLYVPDDVPQQAFSVEPLVLKLKEMNVQKQAERVSELCHLTRSCTESRLLIIGN